MNAKGSCQQPLLQEAIGKQGSLLKKKKSESRNKTFKERREGKVDDNLTELIWGAGWAIGLFKVPWAQVKLRTTAWWKKILPCHNNVNRECRFNQKILMELYENGEKGGKWVGVVSIKH